MSQKFYSEVTLETLNNATTDTDRFLVGDSGTIKYRTGSQLLSDLGVSGLYVPYTGATGNVDLGTHTLSSYNLIVNHTSGSGVAASITKGGSGEALTINKTSGSGNAMSVTGGLTSLVDLTLSSIPNATIDTDRFIVSDGGAIKYRTGAQVLSDIGGQPALTNPITGTGTLNFVSKFTSTGSTLGDSQIFDNGTNVGIGTNIPSSTLQVGNGTGLKNILISGNGNNLGLGGLSVSFLGFATGTISTVNTSGAVPLGVGTRSTQPLVLGTNNAERMRIDSSGNVGIGTSSPVDYQVFGYGANIENRGGRGGGFVSTNSTATHRMVLSVDSSAGVGMIKSVTNTPLTFGVNDSERMRITSSGNVGIGTSSPASANKLEVNGRVFTDQLQYTRAINISDANLDDYVNAGFYNGTNITNAPSSGWFWVTVERYSDTVDWAHQTATTFGSGNTANLIYTRTKTGGIWTNWKKLIDWTDINGTTNYVSKFTGNNSLGNSQIFDTGTNVGIGTTNPNYQTAGRLVVDINGSSQSLLGFSIATNPSAYIAATSTLTELASVSNPLLFTVGSERMRITSGGNVGIGTTTPSEKLTITDGKLFLSTSDPTIGGKIYGYNDTSVNLYSGGLKFQTRYFDGSNYVYADRITINGLGNVGIGTTNPTYKFEANAGSSQYINARFYGSSHSLVQIESTSAGFQSLLSFASPTRIYSTGLQGDGRFSIYDNTANLERFTISTSGNVGIGTSSPSALLQTTATNASGIISSLALENFISTNPANGNGVAIDFRLNNNNNPSYVAGKISLVNTFFRSNTDMIFSVANSDTLNERMRITSSGNVGIGTASPNASAILHLRSTTQGFLPPVMRTGERNGISNPAVGLMIFNEEDGAVQVFTDEGWRTLAWA